MVGTASITCCSVAAKFSSDDDRLGARVLELVLEFARRVQRVDVDDHEPARRIAATATGYCGTLGIMTATRSPLLEALRLQLGGERARGLVDLREA